ncbi:probable receptor-like serine/threonine-protein kinase At4g34500 [Impatiens glandulifera]|uniref:probable receptor-like serine/threonine-protein kinase At4g34500 n=1 Tax=Impatiens glandulifera TaxID=253017 RepID=UPI001FB07B4D|nr:probable receptor-like serine/threonine-protein kinase At4g34500 [Impatiens glandulifera]
MAAAAANTSSIIIQRLEAETSILGLRLYLVISICAAFATISVILIYLCIRFRINRYHRINNKSASLTTQIKTNKEDRAISCCDVSDNTVVVAAAAEDVVDSSSSRIAIERTSVKVVSSSISETSRKSEGGSSSVESVNNNNNMGWGRWFSLKDLERATCCFAEKNIIGEGGYGIVYRGILLDGSAVAVKYLLNNKKSQAEKELEAEIEAIGKVRHKNLVGLLGYCPQGLLVYEYVDNGNLEQWLHGDVGPVSPLTWEIRMKIAVGTAKGLAYLHDGLEPKVVHRDVKSSNILLDRNWNPKVSDFGLAKLLGPDKTYVTTRVMGTFGYVSPEYASTGMLNEGSDVYSFGVLLMEIITGRNPIDYSKPPGEMNLVDWFKGMVGNRRGEQVIDPLLEIHPTPRALKRVLLVCLRCIDLDAAKRPKMGQILHMLEEADHDS